METADLSDVVVRSPLSRTWWISALMGWIGGGLPFGFSTAAMNIPSFYIKSFIVRSVKAHYGTDLDEQGTKIIFAVATSLFLFGGFLGTTMAAYMGDKFGRRKSILMLHVLGLLSALCFSVCNTLNSMELLLLGRVLIGLTTGGLWCIVPMYITEITPPDVRGRAGSGAQLFITIGILFAGILTLPALLGGERWPWGLSVWVVFNIVSAILYIPAVESPKFLYVLKNDKSGARAALQKLTGGYDMDRIEAMLKELQEERDNSGNSAAGNDSWTVGRLLNTQYLIFPLILVILVNIVQQFSGINVVFFYGSSYFTSIGFDEAMTNYAMLAISAINVLATIVAFPLIDSLGRRPLIFGGMVGMVLMMLVLTFCRFSVSSINADSVLQIAQNSTSNLSNMTGGSDVQLPGDRGDRLVYDYTSIVAMVIYVISFAVGLGPIPIFIATELFDVGPRATAVSIGGFINLLCNGTVGMTFEWVLSAMLKDFCFVPFIVIVVVLGTFLWFRLPETKNLPVHEVYAKLGINLAEVDGRSREASADAGAKGLMKTEPNYNKDEVELENRLGGDTQMLTK